MNPLVANLENHLLPAFREVAQAVRDKFPNVWAEVYSHSVGALTEYKGHQFVIDCLIKDASDDQPDNIALVVALERLTTSPEINADVCWGHPSGFVVSEFSAEPLQVSNEVLSDLFQKLPMMYDHLMDAIRRGKPST